MSNVVEEFEKSQMKEKITKVNVGDIVCVSKVIVEGKRKRVQKFEGVVIKKRGQLSRASITLRKIVDKIGVEKSFLVHSELVPEIKIITRGKVRRSKLYYLRERIGAKANRIKKATLTEAQMAEIKSEGQARVAAEKEARKKAEAVKEAAKEAEKKANAPVAEEAASEPVEKEEKAPDEKKTEAPVDTADKAKSDKKTDKPPQDEASETAK